MYKWFLSSIMLTLNKIMEELVSLDLLEEEQERDWKGLAIKLLFYYVGRNKVLISS